ncbi:MAG: FAD-binding protein, partial [Mailhella sp.]|nr:FAD-binding protein [Mailhella sp.]
MSKQAVPYNPAKVDVVVVGGGNAALCAAITAKEEGARKVLILESSPEDFRGGNSRHTRNIRYTHSKANAWLTGPYSEE